MGIGTRAGKKNWRHVLAYLKELEWDSTIDSHHLEPYYTPDLPLSQFVDSTLHPLCQKLSEVVSFISRTKPMKEHEIDKGCAACTDYVKMYRQLLKTGNMHPLLGEKTSIKPKMHILEVHVPAFARKWKTVGFFGEDVIETVHKEYNSYERRMCSLRNVEARMAAIEDVDGLRFEQACKEAARNEL
jgi:hypothetical protein